MAEIRKHRAGTGQSAIAQQVEAALGAAVRPVTPGAPPEPKKVRPSRGTSAQASATSSFTTWAAPRPPAKD